MIKWVKHRSDGQIGRVLRTEKTGDQVNYAIQWRGDAHRGGMISTQTAEHLVTPITGRAVQSVGSATVLMGMNLQDQKHRVIKRSLDRKLDAQRARLLQQLNAPMGIILRQLAEKKERKKAGESLGEMIKNLDPDDFL